MPINYDPQITSTAAGYNYQGLANLGQGIGQAIQQGHAQYLQDQLDQAQMQQDQVTMHHLSNMKGSDGKPIVDPQDMADFQSAVASGNTKKAHAIMSGTAADAATDFAVQRQRLLTQPPQTSYIPPPTGAPPGTPGTPIMQYGTGGSSDVVRLPGVPPPASPLANQPIMVNGQEVGRYDPTGLKMNFYPSQALQTNDGPIAIDPVTDPNTGRRVLGLGINRKTGAMVNTSENSDVVTLDPTKNFYRDNKTGGWKPIPQAQLEAIQSPPAAPTPTPPSKLNPANWFGGSATPAPTATPAATIPPGAQGQVQTALQWAQANPSDPRAAAIVQAVVSAGGVQPQPDATPSGNSGTLGQ